MWNYKLRRCEWQIVIQQVDQYHQPVGFAERLESYPTRQEALDNLKRFGIEHRFIKGRWVPIAAAHDYEVLEIVYREVDLPLTKSMLDELKG